MFTQELERVQINGLSTSEVEDGALMKLTVRRGVKQDWDLPRHG